MPAVEPSLFVTLAPAAFGLLGVIVGAVLTMLKEWLFGLRKDNRDAKYLAVQVVGQLDRYIFACSEVALDDGLCRGQRNEQGNCQPQVAEPKFNPQELSVEWQSIPSSLMYEILDISYKAEVAGHIIDAAYENAYAPDFEDYFEERQFQYSMLGLIAADVASRLRLLTKLPERSVAHWDPVEWLQRQKEKIEAVRSERLKMVERAE